MKIWKSGVFLLFTLLISSSILAQSLPSSELYHQLLRINDTKRILYVAAHPDDENTRLIAYLNNGVHAEVAYLSLTRGDGGQNLLGPQLGVKLGQIRTQELLKARETDGGRQFFTRATDFGYSKNPTETLQNWDRDEILGDVVWVIRKFQPDVIITRFNTTPGITHGHHTTSAILAADAFDLAGDPEAYPEQLNYVETWQPKRLFWNSYNFRSRFQPDSEEQYQIFPVGDFNPLLGETYSQIAADSRTMHKSQGFGATAGIGKAQDYIQFLKGEEFTSSAFENVENRWLTVQGGQKVQDLLQAVIQNFDFIDPRKNIKPLLEVKEAIATLPNDVSWVEEKQSDVDNLILHLLGVEVELNAAKELVSPGERLGFDFIFNNPSDLEIGQVQFKVLSQVFTPEQTSSLNNSTIRESFELDLPSDLPYSQPYWLEKPIKGAMYEVSDQELIGNPFNEPNVAGTLSFELEGMSFGLEVPMRFKYNDRVDGEIQQPVTVVPEVDISLSTENVFLLSETEPEITVIVKFQDQMIDGELKFKGLSESEYRILEVSDMAAQKQRVYQVAFISESLTSKEVIAEYNTSAGKAFDQTTERITYSHIPNLTYFHPASVNLIKADWEISGDKIGYIPGAGDDVPGVLKALGYEVDMLGQGDFSVENFSQYKAIIVGIRAYNTNQVLAENQQILMGYVRSGGTVITQYNTSSGLLNKKMGPYDFGLSRTRVTVQGSPVEFDSTHPLFVSPNRIEKADFDNWVQERGLYFTTDLSPQYETPLTLNEPGEEPTKGALIYAKYGEGTFIYTGISFFRQLPAGVAGATKLFVNMIEQ